MMKNQKINKLFYILIIMFYTAQQVFAALPLKEDGPNPLLKFITAIAGVAISVLAIFLGLKIYKKFILKNDTKSENLNYNETLESPKDFKEAINIFLDKTDR